MNNENLCTLPDMTFDEAQAKHTELKSLHSAMRLLLLEMRDRKGWLALGFSSWEEYGAKEWNYSKSQLDRLATAARIEHILPPMGGEQIPERHLRPMAGVPEDVIPIIWQEANRKAEEAGIRRTEKMVQEAVDDWKAKNAIAPDDKLPAVHKSKNADAIEKEVTLAEFGTYVLGCSNAIAIAQKKESDAQYELKKIKDQAGKIQEASADKIAQIFMGILVDVLD